MQNSMYNCYAAGACTLQLPSPILGALSGSQLLLGDLLCGIHTITRAAFACFHMTDLMS